MPLGKVIAPPYILRSYLHLIRFNFKKKFNLKLNAAREGRLETCLNGETPLITTLFNENKENTNNEDNSVPNRISSPSRRATPPRKQPGLYMIRCTQNDFRYYGESSNLSGRLASHRSMLNRKIHGNRYLQQDWNQYGQENFEFTVLFMGESWEKPEVRRGKELELIVLDRDLCYNFLNPDNPFLGRTHTPEAKKRIGDAMRGRPKDLLGKLISIKGIVYPSISEASRQTGEARKTIRKKVNDPDTKNYFEC